MYPGAKKTNENLLQKLQELEDAYAEALADDTDARSLSLLWDRIKALKIRVKEVSGRKECCQNDLQK